MTGGALGPSWRVLLVVALEALAFACAIGALVGGALLWCDDRDAERTGRR